MTNNRWSDLKMEQEQPVTTASTEKENGKTVGEILREARLAKNLSLNDVEQGISVRARYLEAVENGEYDKTPGEVFVKGMIRSYGNYLGLDGLELVTKYKASSAGIAAEEARSQGIREAEKVRLNIQLKDPRDIGSGTGRMELPNLPFKQIAMGAVAVLILVAGYFAVPAAIDWVSNRPTESTTQETPAQQTASTGTNAATAPVSDEVKVDLDATADCWLEVAGDGKELFSGILGKGQNRSFTAKEKIVIKYGNIGAMKIIANGKLQELHGETGVSVKTYTRETGSTNAANDASAETAQAAGEPQTQAVTEAAVAENSASQQAQAVEAAAQTATETASQAVERPKLQAEPAEAANSESAAAK